MSPTLREVLAREANDTRAPDLDLDAVVGLGEQRLRRRRTTAVLAGAAAVVVALALGFLAHDPAARGTGPVEQPARPTGTPTPAQPVREIVWSDGYHGTRIHLGDRVVRVPESHVHMDVTDDGFVYLEEGGRLWFSDGGAPRRLATTVCGASHSGEPGTTQRTSWSPRTPGPWPPGSTARIRKHQSLVVLETNLIPAGGAAAGARVRLGADGSGGAAVQSRRGRR